MYSCLCTQCTQCTHKKSSNRLRVHLAAAASVCTRWSVHTVCTVYTQCVHTCQMFTTSGRVQLYTVRQYRMSVRCMAASDIRISTSTSSGFSTRIFLRTQICRILKNFFDFSKVPDRFSTSLHSRRKSYAIMATVPSSVNFAIRYNEQNVTGSNTAKQTALAPLLDPSTHCRASLTHTSHHYQHRLASAVLEFLWSSSTSISRVSVCPLQYLRRFFSRCLSTKC
jgi:hypothetical protein